MDKIIQGTTPTIVYKFRVVPVSDISEAYLTVKQNGELLFEKTLSEATVSAQQQTISWLLSQTETLTMDSNESVYFMLNWLTTGGIRGASEKTGVVIDSNYKGVVIGV